MAALKQANGSLQRLLDHHQEVLSHQSLPVVLQLLPLSKNNVKLALQS
jgi:hypothetical protein